MLLAAPLCANASGPDQGHTLDQFFRTSWTADQGAPGGANALAQTVDGYLWLGTKTGLVRFDGVRFEQYQPPRFADLPFNDISALMATPDGGLWIGYRTGGASFLKGDKALNYGDKEGMPSAQVSVFALDSEGIVWASTSRGLLRFEKSHWQSVGADWGIDLQGPGSLLADPQGRLWAALDGKVYLLRPHMHTFEAHSLKIVGDSELIQTQDGVVWVVTEATRQTFSKRIAEPAPGQEQAVDATHRLRSAGCHVSLAICAASDGSIWTGRFEQGIIRIESAKWLMKGVMKTPGRGSGTFTLDEGLATSGTIAFLEDREGNIWVTTQTGLERFRRRNIHPAPFSDRSFDVDLSLAVDPHGAIWAGSELKPLVRIQKDQVSTIGKRRHVVCIFSDLAGVIWIGGWSTLTRFANNRLQDVKVPQELEDRPYRWKVRAITEDRAGAPWISVVQHGVFRLKDNLWQKYGQLADLPQLTAFALWTDSDGRVWFGYTDNRIALADGDSVRTFSSTQGLNVGTVRAFGGRDGHVWAGGQFGLARFDGNQFHRFTTDADGDFRGISGIVETGNGDLWLNQASGLAHISALEIASKLQDPHHVLHYELFDSQDGLRGTASQMNFLPSAVLGQDGKVWISGDQGAGWIDPAQIYRNKLPPPVSIQSLAVDGKVYPATAKIALPPLPANLQIGYTALSLSIPERVRFRYQLEGQDKQWQDVGTRRVAFYTNLGPGNYRFHVIACNNDGVWNEIGAAQDFTIAPAFYQTWWFRLLCLMLAAVILWMAYLYRLRLLTRQIQDRLGARLEERERIARELHDTLLQGFQGLMLRFQAVLKTLPSGDPAYQKMEQVLNRADEVLLEGRQRVRELRAEGVADDDLPANLARYGEEFVQDHAALFSLSVIGTPRALDPTVRNETVRIGREGIANAFRHAQAAKIEAEVTFSSASVTVRIRDDGAGIDAAILHRGKADHWGLSGMRERAQKIGGKLSIWSYPGKGTEIDLSIPANLAYPGTPSRRRRNRNRSRKDKQP